VTHRTARHPIFRIVMHEQGRSLVWLARETGFSHPYVKAVSAGQEKGSPRFRDACARVLGLPEAVLFHANDSSASAPESPDGSDDGAGIAVARAYSIAKEVAVAEIT
jgi:hypothetical protein